MCSHQDILLDFAVISMTKNTQIDISIKWNYFRMWTGNEYFFQTLWSRIHFWGNIRHIFFRFCLVLMHSSFLLSKVRWCDSKFNTSCVGIWLIFSNRGVTIYQLMQNRRKCSRDNEIDNFWQKSLKLPNIPLVLTFLKSPCDKWDFQICHAENA